MKKTFLGTLLLVFLLISAIVPASDYRPLLKKWTRSDHVYVWDNLEARVIWHATYFSDEFRKARLDQLSRLHEWNDRTRQRKEIEDRKESQKEDLFFLGVYSGSSEWAEIGKDTGNWKIVLVSPQGTVESDRFERVPITQIERTLYPFLDKWSQAFIVSFPKTIQGDEPFTLRMTGIPAKSELVWKSVK